MAAKKASKSVMGNLPSTRPARIGGRRETRDGDGTASATQAKPKTARSSAKKKPAKASASATKSRPAKASAAAAKTTTTKKPAAAKTTAAKPRTASSKPRAVRSGSPGLKAAKDTRRPRRPQPSSPPKGTELVTTAVQAAGELAQIGVTLSRQAVKRAARRLTKP
jgi:hypothetical protein